MGSAQCCSSSGDEAGYPVKGCCETDIAGITPAPEPEPTKIDYLNDRGDSTKELGLSGVHLTDDASSQLSSRPQVMGIPLNGSALGNADVAAGGEPQQVDTCQNYDDGSTYYGQVYEGRRHGQGTWHSPSMQYEGQWHSDVQHGDGVQIWADGGCYTGQFSHGKFSGTGRMSWKTTTGTHVYEGQYVDDLKHGFGKFQWADGRVYEGEWRNGKRHGKGSFLSASGKVTTGIWASDKFSKEKTAELKQQS
mmetsp:Transcript_12372/g.29068  ORF Transcript_12372/g.29068 Transcript_12372/m.29068 type:complete len:249 (+) Transcript_12372:80-826(+)